MDAMEELSGSNDHLFIIKGKRTNRPRLPSPVSRGVTSSSVSGGGGGGGEDGCILLPDITWRHRNLLASETPTATLTSDLATTIAYEKDREGMPLFSLVPSFSISNDNGNDSAVSTVEEDEDMANCLILLAKSGGNCMEQEEVKMEKCSKKVLNEIVSNSSTKIKGGFFVHECKTCNKNFPSFQALGGHRASHKKPKISVQYQDTISTSSNQNLDQEDEKSGGKFTRQGDVHNPEFRIQLAHIVRKNEPKIHECSICGSKFSSGQALGGHMRRHRNSSSAKVKKIDVKPFETEKPRRVFQLDLNLPAPEDDHRDLKFQFAADQQHMLLATLAQY